MFFGSIMGSDYYGHHKKLVTITKQHSDQNQKYGAENIPTGGKSHFLDYCSHLNVPVCYSFRPF